MTTLTASAARARLYKLLDEANALHQPIQITGKRSNAVLVSEEDWRAIQETLYLLSIPGMRESIRKGLKAPVDKCAKKLAKSGLRSNAEALLDLLRQDPYRTPPPFEGLVGDLAGAFSRRINIQHRLVYQVLDEIRTVKIIRLWTHCE